jgi:hypothetical protein
MDNIASTQAVGVPVNAVTHLKLFQLMANVLLPHIPMVLPTPQDLPSAELNLPFLTDSYENS